MRTLFGNMTSSLYLCGLSTLASILSSFAYFKVAGPVMPGLSCRTSRSSPVSLSAKPGTSGRGPTRLMSPISTFQRSGSSSSLVRRKNAPSLVTRALPPRSDCSRSALTVFFPRSSCLLIHPSFLSPFGGRVRPHPSPLVPFRKTFQLLLHTRRGLSLGTPACSLSHWERARVRGNKHFLALSPERL